MKKKIRATFTLSEDACSCLNSFSDSRSASDLLEKIIMHTFLQGDEWDDDSRFGKWLKGDEGWAKEILWSKYEDNEYEYRNFIESSKHLLKPRRFADALLCTSRKELKRRFPSILKLIEAGEE